LIAECDSSGERAESRALEEMFIVFSSKRGGKIFKKAEGYQILKEDSAVRN